MGVNLHPKRYLATTTVGLLAIHGYLWALGAGQNRWFLIVLGVLALVLASTHAMPPVDHRSLTSAGRALGWTESRAGSVARAIQVVAGLLIVSALVALLI